MTPILTTSTTKSTPNVEVDMSKLQSKKGLNINEGGLGSSTIKHVATSDPSGKGKDVQVEPSEEEKKRLQKLETEKMNQLNSIMRMRANDPAGLNK